MQKRESSAIIRAVTTLAGALSVPVCVEGIENEAAYEAVLALGCAIGQGWYFGKPMRGGPGARAARGPRTRRHSTLPNSVNG